jgi:hypothetical protein
MPRTLIPIENGRISQNFLDIILNQSILQQLKAVTAQLQQLSIVHLGQIKIQSGNHKNSAVTIVAA